MISSLRRQTTRICCVVTTCLLFMQLALAAYACPRLDVASQPPAAVVAAPSDMANGCETLDPANPNLCLQYCQDGSQLPDVAAISIPVSSSVAMLEIAPPELAGTLSSSIAADNLLARNTAPLLTIRNCCFRI